ncbi:hypothetical protein [Paenibacillus agri]|uniref:Uncharacterized protein n=1 Tax=Paenibacillus agri TaxID=2744309 RepID=A0A850ES52_9BACL|nr:hypothetical protein [Paenibacillus agri]NUU62357.1 hypothetical protein [Paenibacillus agri]
MAALIILRMQNRRSRAQETTEEGRGISALFASCLEKVAIKARWFSPAHNLPETSSTWSKLRAALHP